MLEHLGLEKEKIKEIDERLEYLIMTENDLEKRRKFDLEGIKNSMGPTRRYPWQANMRGLVAELQLERDYSNSKYD